MVLPAHCCQCYPPSRIVVVTLSSQSTSHSKAAVEVAMFKEAFSLNRAPWFSILSRHFDRSENDNVRAAREWSGGLVSLLRFNSQ